MRSALFLAWGSLALLTIAPAASGQGPSAPGAGPISRAMAGASTAAPVDFGSTYRNPANLSGLGGPEFLLGSERLITRTHPTAALPRGVGQDRLADRLDHRRPE